jgi:NADH-quinone oxidoreductase subunit C
VNAPDLARQLKAKFGELLSEPAEFRGELSLTLADAARIVEVCAFAKKELGFDLLLDVTSIDNSDGSRARAQRCYGEDPRWTIVYHLYGIGHGQYLRLKTSVSEELSALPTVTGVWRTAEWHEREIYDMMGIRFTGHPDLRRIIMWEGYPHFPLRKDFPLGGKPTDLPDVAFTRTAPIEGGPFVTAPGGKDAIEREPRVRTPEK